MSWHLFWGGIVTLNNSAVSLNLAYQVSQFRLLEAVAELTYVCKNRCRLRHSLHHCTPVYASAVRAEDRLI